jgi:hypothetical protein
MRFLLFLAIRVSELPTALGVVEVELWVALI